MKGGKREGAGRPVAPDRPKPVSWRPPTQAIKDKYSELGGARWLNRILQELLDKRIISDNVEPVGDSRQKN
jgi:hypothetical protein